MMSAPAFIDYSLPFLVSDYPVSTDTLNRIL